MNSFLVCVNTSWKVVFCFEYNDPTSGIGPPPSHVTCPFEHPAPEPEPVFPVPPVVVDVVVLAPLVCVVVVVTFVLLLPSAFVVVVVVVVVLEPSAFVTTVVPLVVVDVGAIGVPVAAPLDAEVLATGAHVGLPFTLPGTCPEGHVAGGTLAVAVGGTGATVGSAAPSPHFDPVEVYVPCAYRCLTPETRVHFVAAAPS